MDCFGIKNQVFAAIAVCAIVVASLAVVSFKAPFQEGYLEAAPFPRAEYQNTHTAYRVAGTARSTDEEIAHSKAVFDAKSRLVAAIQAAFNGSIEKDSEKLDEIGLEDVQEVNSDLSYGSGHMHISWVVLEVDKEKLQATIWKKYKAGVDHGQEEKVFLRRFEKLMKSQKNKEY